MSDPLRSSNPSLADTRSLHVGRDVRATRRAKVCSTGSSHGSSATVSPSNESTLHDQIVNLTDLTPLPLPITTPRHGLMTGFDAVGAFPFGPNPYRHPMNRASSKPASPPAGERAACDAAKEAWKSDGNRYTAEQLRALSRDARSDLKLRPTTTPVRHAD